MVVVTAAEAMRLCCHSEHIVFSQFVGEQQERGAKPQVFTDELPPPHPITTDYMK